MKTTAKLILIIILSLGFTVPKAFSAQSSKKINSAKSSTAWVTSLSAEIYNGFDEYSTAHQATELNVIYNLNEKNSIDTTLGYDYLMSEYEGESQTEKNFQLEDTEILWKHNFNDSNIVAPLFTVVIGSGLKLPTSETSQTASLQASWVNELTFQGKIPRTFGKQTKMSRFSWRLKNRIYLNGHTYDTSDAMGTSYNSQWDVMNSGSLYYNFSKRWNASISAGQMTSSLYSGRTVQVQFYAGVIDYKASKDLSLYLRGQTKDRVISNNSLFDDDNSQVGIGLVYEM